MYKKLALISVISAASVNAMIKEDIFGQVEQPSLNERMKNVVASVKIGSVLVLDKAKELKDKAANFFKNGFVVVKEKSKKHKKALISLATVMAVPTLGARAIQCSEINKFDKYSYWQSPIVGLKVFKLFFEDLWDKKPLKSVLTDLRTSLSL